MAFIKTTAQAKIGKLKKRVRVVSGGTSASKTYSILPLLITYAASKKNLEISVVSESHPHLRKGCIRDFKKIMQETGNWRPSGWNISSSTYTFANGSFIEFFSADQPDKLRGARRDILFVNEANNIPFEAWNQLLIRTRIFAYLDFNPSHEFWAHTELQNDEDVDWLVLTYLDNEATPKEVVRELEKNVKKAERSDYWKNWVDVYVYGRLGSREGVIFKEHEAWRQLATIPKNAKLIGAGLDFGYSNDPSALIAVFYLDGRFIFDEVCYQTHMQNADIVDKIKANPDLLRVPVYADSAEPKSIDYIEGAGVWVEGVKKGADSIRYGLGLMQEEPFYVTTRSTNLIKELRSYSYRTKDGKTFNEPEKNQIDHCFVGETLIDTIEGKKRIDEIKEGDLVLTRKGYKPVLKVFDNGIKDVYLQSMQLDTNLIELQCTKTHQVWTKEKGFTEIQNLLKGQRVSISKHLEAEHLLWPQTRSILIAAKLGFTDLFGKAILEKYQKATTSITRTITRPIIGLKTWSLLRLRSTLETMAKSVLKRTPNGLKTFMLKAFKRLKIGISQRQAENGIGSTLRKAGRISPGTLRTAKYAEKSTGPDTKAKPNIVIKTARLRHLEVGEKRKERVYDLMVADQHEYFANGLLVHNCIDAARYFVMMYQGERGSDLLYV